MASFLLLSSSRLSLIPSTSASASASSSTSSSATGRALSTSNSAAAPCTRSSNGYGGGGGGQVCDVREGGHRYSSKFYGAPVSVSRVSSARTTTRRRGSSLGNPGVASSALVQKVTANELDSILSAERTSPMIIDFYATWCGPCVVLAQELEQLAVEYGGDIRFLKVDTDEEHELASQMEIRGLPTMVFVSKDVDKLAIRTEGLLPTNAIRDIIEKEILV